MALASEAKSKVISQFRVHKTDTGSPEVQVAILSRRITELTEHFKIAREGPSFAQRSAADGARRRRLLDYLRSRSPERYKTLIHEPWASAANVGYRFSMLADVDQAHRTPPVSS